MLGNRPIGSLPIAGQPAAAPSGGINADAAFTEGEDLFAASATLAVSASSAVTEGADLFGASAAVALAVAAAVAELADSFAASATGAIAAAAALQEDPDAWAAAGTVALVGSSALLEDGDQFAAVATTLNLPDRSADAAMGEDEDLFDAAATLGPIVPPAPPPIDQGSTSNGATRRISSRNGAAERQAQAFIRQQNELAIRMVAELAAAGVIE